MRQLSRLMLPILAITSLLASSAPSLADGVESAPSLRVSVAPATITAGQTSRVCVRTRPNEQVNLYAYTLPNRTYRVVRTGAAANTLPCWDVRPGADTRLYAAPAAGPASRNSAPIVIKVRTANRAPAPRPLAGPTMKVQINVRTGTTLNHAAVGTVFAGEQVRLLCQDNGQSVRGSRLWDHIEYQVTGTPQTKTGWVPDVHVRTGTSGPVRGVRFGNCPPVASGYLMKTRTTVRTGTTSNHAPVGTVFAGERVRLLCQDHGQSVGGSRLWDHIEYRVTNTTRTKTGWVPDAFVNTGSTKAVPTVPFGNCAPLGAATPVNDWERRNYHPFVFVHLWLGDLGGRYYFSDGDIMTEQVRRDPWLATFKDQIRRNELPFKGTLKKSLANPGEAARAAVRDPQNIARFLANKPSDDAALTVLGSYSVRYKVEALPSGRGLMTFDIYNQTTAESFNRVPGPCYFAKCPVIFMRNNRMQEQWIHLTEEFTITYPISCEISKYRCPPILDRTV